MDFFELRFHMKSMSVGENVAAYIRSDDNVFVIRKAGQQKNVKGKERIRAVSCGDDAVILLSEEGKLLSVDAAYTLRPLEAPCDILVSQVACGSQHSVALTRDGQVYTWGQDSSGQLGLGKRKPVVGSPQLVRSLWANPLVQVSAGGEQSFALAVSGSVFSWGKNHRGQLGLGDTTDRHTPTAVQCLNMKKTVHVSCGREHTATLTKGGTVFTFGSGQFGQLGHNSFRDELRPRVVSELWGAKVTEISCGRHHTLVLTGSRRVYSFGCGEQGQLGRREESRQSVPLHVQLPHAPDVTDGHQIGNIYAGGNCSFALCAVNKGVHQGLNPCRAQYVAQQCLDDVIEKWISKCNAKTWKKTQKTQAWKNTQMEIKRMFSSASCVNKSFLDRSGDKHFQTSPKYSGLNLSIAQLAFKKLATRQNLLTEVEAVLMQQLLPSLGGRQVGVEGLRIYLLLSELLHVIQKHKPQQSTQLAKAVAAAIQRLPAESLQVLADWWSSLERSTMIKYVKVWKQALSETLSSDVTAPRSAAVKDLLQVLQCLYNANKKIAEPQRIAESMFCLEIEFNILFLLRDLMLWREQVVGDELPILCCFPFVMNLQSKKIIFDINSILTQAQHQVVPKLWRFFFWLFGTEPPTSFSFFELRLKRASLLEGTLQQLADADHTALKKPLVVYFDGDPQLTNVYMKDFFHKLFEEMASAKSGMFMYNDSKTLAWFPCRTTPGDKTYFLFGVLCGLALYNQSIIHLPFPMALFKKLVGVEPSLDDMVEFSPVVGRTLLYILEDYVDDDIENLYMDFSIVWDEKPVELDPQDPGKPVTSHNKREFVEAYVNYAFSASVEEVFEEFSRGFFEVCERDVVKLFRPEELKGVMVGKESYDWVKLKQNTVYQDVYHKGHPTILMFWEVFEELTEEQKKALLLFVTGFNREPILGMDQVRMIIRVLNNSTEQHFPEAHTCFSILELPFYSTKEVLKARLTEALSHNRGFFD
ncbi:probable E3 ubiquitin-protein ligase HERC3 [Myripristis murdjan]|uniref:probable E3 ubiquitin-protein ligase HERC3 n=1 Tax=Myripristis murdjan TaxID=586833 RepID=UPI001175D252|nr:probable E3 ubiquitin-protein ligase HERC3 [Myripristis murdjan]